MQDVYDAIEDIKGPEPTSIPKHPTQATNYSFIHPPPPSDHGLAGGSIAMVTDTYTPMAPVGLRETEAGIFTSDITYNAGDHAYYNCAKGNTIEDVKESNYNSIDDHASTIYQESDYLEPLAAYSKD